MFFIISDDSVNLSDFIFSTVEVSSTLEQVNHKDMYYVIWNANTKDDFVSWWNQNSAVKKIKKSDSKCSQSNWNNVHHISDWWKMFNQKAVRRTEIFCLICKKCDLVLTHSTYSRNDSSEMKKHLENWECDYNATTNCATSDVFMILISYLQDIMITIFDNNS